MVLSGCGRLLNPDEQSTVLQHVRYFSKNEQVVYVCHADHDTGESAAIEWPSECHREKPKLVRFNSTPQIFNEEAYGWIKEDDKKNVRNTPTLQLQKTTLKLRQHPSRPNADAVKRVTTTTVRHRSTEAEANRNLNHSGKTVRYVSSPLLQDKSNTHRTLISPSLQHKAQKSIMSPGLQHRTINRKR